MRCKACNVILEGHDLKRRDPNNNEFLDLCGTCIKSSFFDEPIDYAEIPCYPINISYSKEDQGE